MLSVTDYVNIFVTLLAIVDPLGAIPLVVAFTAGRPLQFQKRMIWITALTVGGILIGTALFGELLLRFFGISIASFRVAGGLLLLLIGINMLHGQGSFDLQRQKTLAKEAGREDMAVVPLAIPLLSGPGAISSMTLYAGRSHNWEHTSCLIGIGFLIASITWITLRLARPIGKALGRTGLSIAVRLMGLLLSAAGVQFIATGLAQLFPVLQKI